VAEAKTGEDAPSAAAPSRRWPRRLVKSLIAVAVLGALAGGAVYGLRQVYFLGTDPSGRAALYRGLPYELPLGIELYTQVYAAPVQVSAIPANRRDSATDHTLRSHDDAADLLADLQAAAEPPVRKSKPSDDKRPAEGRQRNGGSPRGGGSGGGTGQ
jgi:hypothetical protein